MSARPARLAALFAATALLGACAGLQRPAATADWQAQSERLRQLSAWTLRAKASLRTPTGAETARLYWRQRDGASELTLSGPLGTGAVAISRRGDRLRYRDGSGVREFAADDPAALAAAVGWPVPVEALGWWLRGLPAPAPPAEQRFAAGLPRRITQGDWVVRYEAFTEAAGLLLPQALTLRYPPGGVEVRLVAARWQPETPDVP